MYKYSITRLALFRVLDFDNQYACASRRFLPIATIERRQHSDVPSAFVQFRSHKARLISGNETQHFAVLPSHLNCVRVMPMIWLPYQLKHFGHLAMGKYFLASASIVILVGDSSDPNYVMILYLELR
ncbi:MAG TPA: hypothetical protein VGY31_14710 [Terriglobia bacterium]|nr:hypothetical protein [Terriglobia bacterium]